MKIIKLSETLVSDISTDKVDEILDTVKSISELLNEKNTELNKISNDLSNFSNKRKKSNDQIDDSILIMDRIKNNIIDMLSSLDSITTNLEDYKENGRKYIY